MLCMNVGILCMHVDMVCPMNAIDMLEMLCMLNLTQITPHICMHTQFCGSSTCVIYRPCSLLHMQFCPPCTTSVQHLLCRCGPTYWLMSRAPPAALMLSSLVPMCGMGTSAVLFTMHRQHCENYGLRTM